MPDSIVITIDGPAGVGKSTLAKSLATALELPYLDTGAMFRLVAFKLGVKALTMSEDELGEKLAGFSFSLKGEGESSTLFCNGEPADQRIRTEEVASLAAELATKSVVRSALKSAQQLLGMKTSLVCEGRDMGTAVFPASPCKFFLEASAEERARRRCKQLEEMGIPADYNLILGQINARDAKDRNRAEAPLRAPKDATIIDTDGKLPNDLLLQMLDIAKRALGDAPQNM